MRPMGLAREWHRTGNEVHVLTGPGDRGGEYTPDLRDRAARSGAVVHRAPAHGIPKPSELRPAFSRPVQTALRASPPSRLRQILSQWRHFPDYQRGWIGPASELASVLHGSLHFDVVFSTSPPESAHYVARGIALKRVPWVADFRDQWSEYLLARWDPLSRWLIDRIARRVLAPAWRVTGVTLGVSASMGRAIGRQVDCVRNGFDPFPAPDGPVRPRTLGYLGRVDPLMQHPWRLWEPLRRLRETGCPWTVDFFLSPGGGGGAAVSPPADIEGLVRVHQPLPHEEALRAMQTMNALLVLAWETRGGEDTVAGKFYEYVGSGRPMLVCAPPNFEARILAEQTGTGLGAWSPDEIASALVRLETFRVDPAGRAALSRERAALALLALFTQARQQPTSS